MSNIRITAQLADRQAARERLIFFAGGLVGVSGGALVWFFELTAGAIASGRRTRRRKSEESPVPNRRNPGVYDDRGSVADESSGSEQAVVNAPDGEFYISSAENQINSALSDFGLDVRERGMRLFRQAGVGFLTVVVLTVIARRARRKT